MPSCLLSLIVPTYNVASYLPDFLACLDTQRGGLDGIEIVFCNDGSTDQSAAIIEAWIDRSPDTAARLISKENGGLSSARNAGLEVAEGEWVTFPDPDDILTPTYLSVVRKFLRSKLAQRVNLAAGNLVYLYESDGHLEDTHPLRFKFTKHHRVVDLERHPAYIHLHANTGFYRRELLDEFGLRFDGRIRPNFEDAHLTALYLAQFDRPRIAMLEDAVYLYRRRADGSSLVQGSWSREEKYLTIPRYGWLDLVHRATAERGRVPRWMQNLVLYDLSFYFQMDARTNSPLPGLSARCKSEFLDLLDEIMTYLDQEVIEAFQINPVSVEIRRAMLMGLKRHGLEPTEGYLDRIDEHQHAVRVRYYHGELRPAEEYRSRGHVIQPVHAKVRPITFFGRAMMYERTAWLPSNFGVSLSLDGRPLALRVGMPELPRYTVGPSPVWRGLADCPPPLRRDVAPGAAPWVVEWSGVTGLAEGVIPGELLGPRSGRDKLRRGIDGVLQRVSVDQREDIDDSVTKAMAKSPYGWRYRDAWLLIDRDTAAQDNAEHLYRYLRAEQPHVNAWFVLSTDSPDWARLKAAGFRLIPHGSREHAVALLRCRHVVSSQIDHYITAPLDRRRFGRPNWLYTFLQHGVTKDDLSNWINWKPISLMITVTPDEHESIVGDGTPYRYTSKEVKLVGFPRHDRLLSLAKANPWPAEPLLLVTPTWRRELLTESASRRGNERDLRADFWESEYAKSWRALLESERLEKAAAEFGWRVAFVPHPNMQGYVDKWPAPPHVSLHRFDTIDIQRILARGGMLVTDYSSLAFEMAYIERPVVYFQFDRQDFFKGMHAYRCGTWSYPDQGFGPVTEDVDAAVDAITAIMARDGAADPMYAARMRDSFPFRDGQCSRRTYEAVDALYEPLPPQEICERLTPTAHAAQEQQDRRGEGLNA